MSGGRFVVPKHLAVTAEVAPPLLSLVADGRRWARVNGLTLSPAVSAFLADLETFVAELQGPGLVMAEPAAVRWLSTTSAAELLGLSERQVRSMAGRLRSRRVGGRRQWDEADVLAEVEARADYRNTAA